MVSRQTGVLDVVEFLLLHPKLFAVLLFVLVITGTVLTTCGGLRHSASANKPRVENPTALEMMHVAFVGGHSPSEIEAQVRRAAAAFKLPATDQNFSRMGSALVALRRESGVSEMELIRCARAMGEEVAGTNVGLDFPSMAGMCAAYLSR